VKREVSFSTPLSSFSARALLILGVLTFTLLIYSYYSWRMVVVQQTPLLDTLMQVKVDLVDSHATLMELVERHHHDLDKQDVSDLLDRAERLTHGATAGESSVGEVTGVQLDDDRLTSRLAKLTTSISLLQEHLEPWVQSEQYNKETLGEVHDELYATAMRHAEVCDERIHEIIHETLEQQQQIFMLLLLVWGGSLGLVWWKWRAVNRNHVAATDTLHKLSQAVDQAGEFIMITNRQGTVEYVNPAFSRISGFSEDEIIGAHVSLLGGGEENELFFKNLRGTISEGKEWHGEFIARRKNGESYPAMMSISPIRNCDEETSHYVVVQQDLSEHEALQEQLRQSTKMESIGTLAGGIAHDFNNILAGFMGNIFLIRKELKENPEVLKRLDTLDTLSQSAAKMVSQLLTFARKDIVRMQPLGFTAFFHTAVELARVAVPANVNFTSKNCADDANILGSDNQLQQALINLIANASHAVKKADQPYIQVTAELYSAEDEFLARNPELMATEFVCISVADNGYGISQDQIKKIFEPFFTTKEVGQGTGLGLSMVYGTVQRHGGVIEVESEIGKGTTFRLYLPKLSTSINQEPSVTNDIVRGMGETILIVDDDFQVIETNRQLLTAFGYHVLEAHDGQEAVEVFKANREEISLIIMDCVMPKMGGAMAASIIFKDSPDAKIIFMTGYDNEATLDEELTTPNTQVLYKPCAPDRLSVAIRKELDSID